MRRLFLSLLLPQLFLALSVGSAVTTCQAAWAFGIDVHETAHADADHGHSHHGHHHDPAGDKTPCDGDCPFLVEEATAPSLVKVPAELAPLQLPLFALLPGLLSGSMPPLTLPPAEPLAPPSPPLPVLTGSFLI